MLEMLNHGINIIALWIIVDIIEKKTGVRKISELSGLGSKITGACYFFCDNCFWQILRFRFPMHL